MPTQTGAKDKKSQKKWEKGLKCSNFHFVEFSTNGYHSTHKTPKNI
jgi:hypothetical protein